MNILISIILYFFDMAWMIICFLFLGLRYLVKVAFRIAVIQTSNKEAFIVNSNNQVACSLNSETVAQAPVSMPVSEPRSHEVRSKAADITSKCNLNSLQVVPIDDVGNLTLSTNSQKRICKRKLTITNNDLKSHLGLLEISLNDLQLPDDLSSSDVSMYCFNRSSIDVEVLLNELIAKKNSPHKQQDLEPISRIAEKTATQEVLKESLKNDGDVQPSVLKKTKTSLPRDVDSQALKPKKRYFGRFVEAGRGYKPGKNYKQFFVAFHNDEKQGDLDKVWGNDLSHAIDLAKPEVGDQICITSFGYQPFTMPDETASTIHRYDISVVG